MRGDSPALDSADTRMLEAALDDETAPDHVAVRALIALAGEGSERVARATAMGREFVAAVRRRIAAGRIRDVLAERPSTVERVLDAATMQIVSAGRPELAIGDVAAAVGMPRRTLYRSYAAHELVDACQRRATTLWRARFFRRIDAADVPADQRLFTVFDEIGAWVASERFADDQVLCVPAGHGGRGDELCEHVTAIARFATELAAGAEVDDSNAFGIYVATAVLGAAAWLGRRDEARAAAVRTVERLTGITRQA